MGLCTESFVKGLEVGNMVFNVYKADHVKRTKSDLPLRIVYVGHGLDRIPLLINSYPTSNEDMSVGSTLMQLDGCFTINHSLLTIIELAYQRWNPTDQAAEIIVKNSQNTGQKEVQMKAKGGEQLSSDLTVYDLDHTHYHARDYGNNDEVSPLNTTLISCPTQESTSKSGQDHDNGKLTLFLAKPEGSRFEGSFAEILADRTAAVFDVVDVGKAGHCVTHQIVTALTEQHIHHKSDGPRVWQASAKKTVVQAHLDITHFAALKEEEVEQIEDYANKLVTEELVIRKTHMKKEDAERQHGFSLYQGGVVPGLDVRVVSMLKPAPKTRHQNDHLAAFHSACPTVHDAPEDDVVVGDVKACCGLHLNNSAQVRSIRILCSNCGLTFSTFSCANPPLPILFKLVNHKESTKQVVRKGADHQKKAVGRSTSSRTDRCPCLPLVTIPSDASGIYLSLFRIRLSGSGITTIPFDFQAGTVRIEELPYQSLLTNLQLPLH
ncbi:putative Alanine--tRNA ligase [Blattamonas nauphoetae]|uniref:Alanine--tRNA ligase n=1 Tax=Blattamonas nauphoetae TaxID=2049346 RepID=A0ABQ9WZX4_9EUKA|nr:putative Alanine--tRNA ligase [Blattamonas nauphoetae]